MRVSRAGDSILSALTPVIRTSRAQAWTQGEDEDSRYWFPCYDYPNSRPTSEVIATVPEKFTAVSNGALIGTSTNTADKTRIFHWRHEVPHSTLPDHAGGR